MQSHFWELWIGKTRVGGTIYGPLNLYAVLRDSRFPTATIRHGHRVTDVCPPLSDEDLALLRKVGKPKKVT